jgi:lysophospholipase L1-like esterase
VFYIGDSTMRNGTNGDGWNAEWGFGLFAQEWFDENEIVVENHALGGTSSRTYYNYEWAKVKEGIREGDYVVIDFGHNDGGKLWEIRSSINGTSPTETRVVTNDKGVEETIYTFGQYLRFYIDEVRALGAIPILCSRTPRADLTTGKSEVGGSYRLWNMEIAKEKDVAFIDLNAYAVQMYNTFSQWKVAQLYHGGNLHTSLLGAWYNAYAHAQSIASDEKNPLRQYLKDMTPAKLDIMREPGKPYTFTLGGDDTSARGTYRSGKWGLVYNTIEKGDTVLICFGNNERRSQVTNGELGAILAVKDSMEVKQITDTKRWATVYSYGWYIHYFLNDIKQKEAVGIIVNVAGKTQSILAQWNNSWQKHTVWSCVRLAQWGLAP